MNVKADLRLMAFHRDERGAISDYMSRKPKRPKRKYPKTYLPEWRKHRGLTQKQVVARLIEIAGEGEINEEALNVPKTEASLSRIENGEQPYTQSSLEALAVVYETTSDQLLGRNPLKEGKLIQLPLKATDQQIEQIQKMVEVLIGTGTNG